MGWMAGRYRDDRLDSVDGEPGGGGEADVTGRVDALDLEHVLAIGQRTSGAQGGRAGARRGRVGRRGGAAGVGIRTEHRLDQRAAERRRRVRRLEHERGVGLVCRGARFAGDDREWHLVRGRHLEYATLEDGADYGGVIADEEIAGWVECQHLDDVVQAETVVQEAGLAREREHVAGADRIHLDTGVNRARWGAGGCGYTRDRDRRTGHVDLVDAVGSHAAL